MLVAVRSETAETRNKSYAYKKRSDDVLLSRGNSKKGKIFKSGSSEDEILSILNDLTLGH